MFFHKNKRKSAFCTKRIAFCVLFLVITISVSTAFILKTNAQLVPVQSVEITSGHSNFENNEPGSWKITKSAKWTGVGKAKITFEVESLPLIDESKYHDIIMIIDNSGSMDGNKINQVKTDAIDVTNALLANQNNRVALITFGSYATILSNLSNDKEAIVGLINNITVGDSTNYYDGLVKAGQILDDYTKQDDRELIILFLTDGYPNKDTPNEIAQYKLLKETYPFITINGVQYEMGDTVLQPIIDISDNQFIADMSSLNNVLFSATVIPFVYEDFVITDFINDEYWTIAGIEAIEASLGAIGLEYDGSTPKIIWDMSGAYHSGRNETMTIEINLKSGYLDQQGLLLPTNTHEKIESSIPTIPNEDIDNPGTPILKDSYDVIYDPNKPDGCELSGIVPETTSHTVFSTVELFDSRLSCSNYDFKGWRIFTANVKRVNGDYFIMPEEDVYITAVWARPDISKTLDGTAHVRATATFDRGSTLNAKMKHLSGQPDANNSNTTITAFRRSDTPPNDFDITNSDAILSSSTSEVPIYAWFDNGVIYYYSDADDIYTGQSMSSTFKTMNSLTDISGLSSVNTSNTTNMSYMFWYTTSLENIDDLRYWNVSNVESMSNMFDHSGITNIDGAINWQTSSLIYMSGMFDHAENLISVTGAANWDTSRVTSLSHLFWCDDNLTSLAGLENWDTSSNTSLLYSFSDMSKLEDITALTNWDVSKVEDFADAFSFTNRLTNLEPLRKWKTTSATSMQQLFRNATAITNIDALIDWDLSNVTNIGSMFSSASNLTNMNGALNWDTSNVTRMGWMFNYCRKLTNISGLAKWDTSKATSFENMFQENNALSDISPIEKWNTDNIENMAYMFDHTSALSDLSPIKKWNTSKVTNMKNTFSDMPLLENTDDLALLDTSNVTDMSSIFYGDSALTNIGGLNDWNVSRVTNMSQMFYRTNFSDTTPLDDWDVKNVQDMSYMFSNNQALLNLNGLSGWQTDNLQKINAMFNYDINLSNIEGISDWNVTKVTDMSYLFQNADSLVDINALRDWKTLSLENMKGLLSYSEAISDVGGIADWDTSHVTNMAMVFYANESLANIPDLSGWDTSNVTNMNNMFYNDNKLEDISGISNWDVSSVKNMEYMFYNNSKLTNIEALRTWNTTSLENIKSTFGLCRGLIDLSPLNNWAHDNITNFTNTFGGISDSVPRPAWYEALVNQ